MPKKKAAMKEQPASVAKFDAALVKDGIRVSAYWTEVLPKERLQKKLHEAVALARAQIETRNAIEGEAHE